MIGRRDQEAEKTDIFLLAMKMKRQAKWRWVTLGVALATLLVATLSNQVRRVFGTVRSAKAALFWFLLPFAWLLFIEK